MLALYAGILGEVPWFFLLRVRALLQLAIKLVQLPLEKIRRTAARS